MDTRKIELTVVDATQALTLRQLRDRLSAIIDMNEERGWAERNELPVTVRIQLARTPSGRRRAYASEVWVPVRHASASMVGLRPAGNRLNVVELMAEGVLAKSGAA